MKRKQTPLVRLEYASGELFNLNVYLNRLMKTQDIDAWRRDPEGLNKWVKDTIRSAISHLDAVIQP